MSAQQMKRSSSEETVPRTPRLKEIPVSLLMVAIAGGASKIAAQDITTINHYTTALLAVNIIIFIGTCDYWATMIGTTLSVLHLITIFIVSTDDAEVNPYLLIGSVTFSTLLVLPTVLMLPGAPVWVRAAVPAIAGLAQVGMWGWMRYNTKFDAYFLDLACICVATVTLALSKIPRKGD